MKSEKYTSLELSKQIDEVARRKGIFLPMSEYVWKANDSMRRAGMKDSGVALRSSLNEIATNWFKIFPAYDTFELGEMLPEEIELQSHVCGKKTGKHLFSLICGKGFCTYSRDTVITENQFYREAKTEPEARSKTLLHLLNNDLYPKLK